MSGSGIGGLVTALKLHRAGIDVKVFESVQTIKALGVDTNLLPHSVRVLTDLGLAEELEKISIPTAEIMYVNKFGQQIWQEDRGIAILFIQEKYAYYRQGEATETTPAPPVVTTETN
ncbi:FAD-dependent monooxygenase [Kurthia massiliensis]|uniref:FAD-dependent monooxygenase n=1 Tax=Kurthia massiliensis TaxID=1033739 RepID=UPI00028835FB|nr:NAD(P)-binding protein [Kurthia massiliensis]